MAAKFMKKWNNKKWNTKSWNSKTWNTSNWNTNNWNTGTWNTSTTKSPYATAFVNGVKNGMPCGMVVSTISKKTGKSTSAIFKSLTKAGWCKCQKVNGQWIYWPTIKTRTNKTNATTCKVMMWQNFADWCMASGTCTPTTFNTKSTSAKTFTTFMKNGFGKTVKAGTTTTTTKKTRKTTAKRSSTKHHRKTGTTRTWNTGRKTATTTWTSMRNNRKRTTWNRTGSTKSYKFPTYSSRTNTTWRRYARAA